VTRITLRSDTWPRKLVLDSAADKTWPASLLNCGAFAGAVRSTKKYCKGVRLGLGKSKRGNGKTATRQGTAGIFSWQLANSGTRNFIFVEAHA